MLNESQWINIKNSSTINTKITISWNIIDKLLKTRDKEKNLGTVREKDTFNIGDNDYNKC